MGNQNPSDERRKRKRLKIRLEVKYHVDSPPFVKLSVGDKETEAIALDLSEGGIAILTDHDIPVATQIFMVLMLSCELSKERLKSHDTIKTTGEVRSNILTGVGKHRLGIAFQGTSEDDRVRIARFVIAGLSHREEPYIY